MAGALRWPHALDTGPHMEGGAGRRPHDRRHHDRPALAFRALCLLIHLSPRRQAVAPRALLLAKPVTSCITTQGWTAHPLAAWVLHVRDGGRARTATPFTCLKLAHLRSGSCQVTSGCDAWKGTGGAAANAAARPPRRAGCQRMIQWRCMRECFAEVRSQGASKPRKLQVHASVSGLDHERVSLGCHAACDGRRGACNGASAHRAAAIPSALTRRWASAAAAACVLAARRLCQRVWPALLLPDSPAASLPAKEVAVGSSLAGPLARARFGSGLQRRRAPRHTWMLSGRSCRTACTALSNAACHERASSSLSKPWHVR